MRSARLANLKRFSLRTLFVLMTTCCVGIGLWSAYVNPYRLQAQSLAEVRRLNGNFTTSPAKAVGVHRWLVTTLVGEDAFAHVTTVDLAGKKVDDNVLQSLAGLIYLRELRLDYTAVTDNGILALRSMKRLRQLSLRYTSLSDPVVPQFAAFPKLETLLLTGTKISDAALADLAKLGGLSQLFIRWTNITNPGAEKLSATLPNCAIYHHALNDG